MITTLLILWNLTTLLHTGAGAGDLQCSSSVDDMGSGIFDCSHRGLRDITNKWPEDFNQFNGDQNILLNYNGNDIQLVKQFPALQTMKVSISIKNNKISEIEESAFSDIKHLHYLDLSHNQLTGVAVREETLRGEYAKRTFKDLSLEILNVAHNSIHSLDRRAFAHTPNLTQLFIQHNPFKILDSVTVLALSTLSHLEVLDMSYIGIDNIPEGTFRHLNRLQKLDLSGNQLTSVPVPIGEIANSLQFLILNNNLMAELADESFLGLHQLKTLELSENDALVQVKSNTFSQLTSLKVLHLCHNPNLHSISHSAFTGTRANWTLKDLYLDGNKLSGLPADLLPWKNLNILSLSGNIWQCDCDLANTILNYGAFSKIPKRESPRCTTPIKMSGRAISDISDNNCVDLIGNTPKDVVRWPRKFIFKSFQVNYLLTAIIMVGVIVIIGMAIGLGIKYSKKYISTSQTPQTIRYTNVNEETV